MKKSSFNGILGLVYLFFFLLLTAALAFSCFGDHTLAALEGGAAVSECDGFFCSFNGDLFKTFGSNPVWYKLSEVLGTVCLCIPVCFALLGALQLLKRKSLKKVDLDLLFLAGLYAVTAGCYLLFEKLVLNYRPVILDGEIEASYPSTHTVLVCVIAFSAAFFLGRRLRNRWLRWGVNLCCFLLAFLVALGRLFGGVHWFSDVLGSILLGGSLVFFYKWATRRWMDKK